VKRDTMLLNQVKVQAREIRELQSQFVEMKGAMELKPAAGATAGSR
jgi:hypothetical protein